ncbi:phage fiber-tail adaptor protein [Acetobacter thailandicus]|uniref:phage fiber-tail adaptor protein n=1 Tax=Acetobacter thailandicus TaxID=1502842 RepID=UPI001BAAB3CB|nr:hypothetical protein [Acetobacter thailandicus]MBS1003156.1 hypothetical protein [Acetobacter thailandicus]
MTNPITSGRWSPSSARTIEAGAPVNLRARGLLAEITPLSLAPKNSGDVLDFSVDFSALFDSNTDALSKVCSVSIANKTNDPSELTILWTSIVNGLACVFLGGGITDTIRSLTVTAATRNGLTLSTTVELAIIGSDNCTPCLCDYQTLPDGTGIPPNAMVLPGGSILTKDVSNVIIKQASRLYTSDLSHYLLYPNGKVILAEAKEAHTDVILIA